MEECCRSEDLLRLTRRKEQRDVLRIVLAVNAALFGVELCAGLFANSTALLGDSLDMLGDALVYGFTLFVLDRSERVRAYGVVLKGLVMSGFGLFVITEAASKILHPVIPVAESMGLVGLAALAGNGFCYLLLRGHRSDDLNMRSTWLCSRNDLVANVAVLVAAGLVAATSSLWPDVCVGVAIATLFSMTAFGVLSGAVAELRQVPAAE